MIHNNAMRNTYQWDHERMNRVVWQDGGVHVDYWKAIQLYDEIMYNKIMYNIRSLKPRSRQSFPSTAHIQTQIQF